MSRQCLAAWKQPAWGGMHARHLSSAPKWSCAGADGAELRANQPEGTDARRVPITEELPMAPRLPDSHLDPVLVRKQSKQMG